MDENRIEYRPIERRFILGIQVILDLAHVNWNPNDLLQMYEPQQIEQMIRDIQKQKREQEEISQKFIEMDIEIRKETEKFRWGVGIAAITALIIF